MLVRLLLLAVEEMTSLSRIIRSTFAQVPDDAVKEIRIRDVYTPIVNSDEEEFTVSIEDVLAEREQLLAEARASIEQEKNLLEQQRLQQLAEIEQLRLAWEEEKPILQQKAYDEGFAQGYEEGLNKANAQMQHALETANQVILDAKENAEKYIESQEYVVLELGVTAAERILGASLEKNEELFVSIVKRGLKEAREMNEIKIYVSPEYYAIVTKNRDELMEMFPTDVPFMIFVNDDLQSTESFIETNHGRIVISIDEQLHELRLKLSEILDSKE